jgi:hypothetical protein
VRSHVWHTRNVGILSEQTPGNIGSVAQALQHGIRSSGSRRLEVQHQRKSYQLAKEAERF